MLIKYFIWPQIVVILCNLSNLFYNKISKNNILISDNTVFPIINQISIDYKDFNIFDSNWSKNYYNNSGQQPVAQQPITMPAPQQRAVIKSNPVQPWLKSSPYAFSTGK